MQTIREILKLGAEFLSKKGIIHSKRIMEEIISEVLKIKRLQLYMELDRPLIEQELNLCREYLLKRSSGMPLQYIFGEVQFYNCKIKVNPSVLIPRQETEILVDKIVTHLSKLDNLNGLHFWDICCGSGCIGIALKKKFPMLEVTLSDISKEALKVAAENAAANDVQVTLLEGDLLNPFSNKKAQFVVCNPPYITEHEFSNLEKDVRLFEPKCALVSGQMGTECYEILSKNLQNYLLPQSILWLEIGKSQGQSISQLFSHWKNVLIEKDWAGHDRFATINSIENI